MRQDPAPANGNCPACGRKLSVDYAASKFALVGLSLALRQDLEGTGVPVSMVYPGGVMTDFGGIGSETKDPTFLTLETIAEVVLDIIGRGPEAWVRGLTIMPLPAVG